MPGSYNLGEDGFGDELPGPVASVATAAPGALFFDPQTRRHAIYDNGKYVFIHFIDAEVIHCLHMAKGKFLSAKDSGSLYWTLPSPHDPRALTMVQDWTRLALARPLSGPNPDIALGVIDFEAQGSYISKISVAYTNLRLWPFASKDASVAFG